MSLMVIDKTSGKDIVCNNDREKAIWQATKCGVAGKDMVFVAGEVDIRVYKMATTIVGQIAYLPGYLFKHGKGRDVVDAAKQKLDLWMQVVKSRVVDHPEKYSFSLTDIFGRQLAEEIMVTVNAFYHTNCVVYAPATVKNQEEARREGKYLSSRHRKYLFMLVGHSQLGVWIVGPSTMFTRYQAFKIVRIFLREKR